MISSLYIIRDLAIHNKAVPLLYTLNWETLVEKTLVVENLGGENLGGWKPWWLKTIWWDFRSSAIWWILTSGITEFREFLQHHIEIWWKSQNWKPWWLETLVVENFGGWKPFGGFLEFRNLVVFNHQSFSIQGISNRNAIELVKTNWLSKCLINGVWNSAIREGNRSPPTGSD